jgi:hypothetical protein
MIRSVQIISSAIIIGATFIYGQAVSFSNPSPWVTLRNDSIVAHAQVDTVQLQKKTVKLSLVQINKGKKKVIASKSAVVTETSMDFSFGKIKKDVLGGSEYLNLEWSVSGTEEKGSIGPIGIVDLSKIAKTESVKAVRVKDGCGSNDAQAGIKNEQFGKIGKIEFATAWNKDAFFIIIKKDTSSNIQFAFDGKSGKNAFLSYPDRIISYQPASDFISGKHFSREIAGDTLKYLEKVWKSELSKDVVGDRVIIKMPWYDTGIIPFEERTIGMAIFASSTDGKTNTSLPEKAQLYVPGTWGDVLLQK